MKKSFALITILSFSFALASCGKRAGEEDQLVSLLSGQIACSESQIEAYNDVSRECFIENSQNREQVKSCIQKADSFISQNQNINCAAWKISAASEIMVNESAIRSLQGEFTRERYLNYTNGMTCGIYFIQDYLSYFKNSCKDGNITTASEARTCVQGTENFLKQYPQFNCSTSSSESTVTVKAKELEKLVTDLNEALK